MPLSRRGKPYREKTDPSIASSMKSSCESRFPSKEAMEILRSYLIRSCHIADAAEKMAEEIVRLRTTIGGDHGGR